MDANFWTTAHQTEILQYLKSALGYDVDLMLPTAGDLAPLAYANTLTVPADIGGLAVTATTKRLSVGQNRAAIDAPCFSVGTSLFVRRYQGDYLGNNSHQCPVGDFHKAVLRDLTQLATLDSGRRLLASIEHHGNNGTNFVYICWGEGIHARSEAEPMGTAPGRLDNGNPGVKANVKVVYNPLLFGIPKVRGMSDGDAALKPGKWGAPGQKPPDVTLFHEMIHADDMLRGIFDDKEVARGTKQVKISEMRCVGLSEFSDESLYTENSYRRERGVAERDYYTSSDENKSNKATPDARLTALHAYLSTSVTSLEQFQQETKMSYSSFRPRNKIVALDNALLNYNKTLSWSDDPIVRLCGLAELLDACNDYAKKNDAKRDVSGLKTRINAQADAIVTKMVANPNAATVERVRAICGALEARYYNQADQSAFDVRGRLIAALNTLQNDRANAGIVTTLLAADLTKLDAMAINVAVPQTTRDVIAEVVAVARMRDVDVLDTPGGSTAGPVNGRAAWFVKYGQYLPDDLRLATYVHELTHVASHKHYNNTPIMFSYPVARTKAEIKQLITTREGHIAELVDLAKRSGLDAYQKHWVIDDKLEYARTVDSGKCLLSLPVDHPKRDDYMAIAAENKGLSQVLWEYDTVINQIAMYLSMWGVIATDAFHARVLHYAAAAYVGRTT